MRKRSPGGRRPGATARGAGARRRAPRESAPKSGAPPRARSPAALARGSGSATKRRFGSGFQRATRAQGRPKKNGKGSILRARRPVDPVRLERFLDGQPWDTLAPHLLKAGADVQATMPRLREFTRQLLQWNGAVSNLVSRHDEPRIVERHIREAVEPAAWLIGSGASRWIDLGSGGGIPAIPLVIVGVGGEWMLVESRRTKTLFLRRVSESMQLSSVQVVNERMESLEERSELRAGFDGFTSRATLPLGPTLRMAGYFIKPGGFAFLWKGSRREEEMRADPSWTRTWELDGLLGIGSGQTVVARFSRKADESVES